MKDTKSKEYLQTFRSVGRWLNRLGAPSRRVRLAYFRQFVLWMQEEGNEFKAFTPDDLIEYQEDADKKTRYDILDMLQRYVLGTVGTANTKNARYSSVKSFFLHNRAPLPADVFNIKAGNGITKSVQGTLTAEEVKHAILTYRPAFAAAYLSMYQGALDQEMFTHWNTHGYESLMEQLKQNPDIVKIELPGRKSNRNVKPYYTFIGSDAIKAIRTYLKRRPNYKWTVKIEGRNRTKIPDTSKPITAIFVNQYGNPISKSALAQYWIRHLRVCGIVNKMENNRSGKGLHEMRDVWSSIWTKGPAEKVCGEYFMGHEIDSLNYDKSFRDTAFYLNEYRKNLNYVNIMSRPEAYGLIDKITYDNARMKEMKDRIDTLENLTKLLPTNQRALWEEIKNPSN